MGQSFGPFVDESMLQAGLLVRRGTMLSNQMSPGCMRSHVWEANLDAGVILDC